MVASADDPFDRHTFFNFDLCARLTILTIYLRRVLMKLPAPLRWLKKGWMAFSHALGIVMSKIILTILWFVGFGAYAVIIKIIRLVSRRKKQETYWIETPKDYENSMRYQF